MKDSRMHGGNGGKHSKVIKGKFAEGGPVLKTERTPSGAQQYVRGKDIQDKSETLNAVEDTLVKQPTVSKKAMQALGAAQGSLSGDEMIENLFRDKSGKLADDLNSITRRYSDRKRR